MAIPRYIVAFDHGINTARRDGATVAERFDAYAAARADDIAVITDHYPAGPFPRWNMLFGANQKIAESKCKVVTHWHLAHPRARIVLVGHSNGCDITRRTAIALDDLEIPVARLIWLAAPLERTIEKNGLAKIVGAGTKVSNWVMELDEVLAPDDAPIRAALRWPYGNCGKEGLDDADGWTRRFDTPDPSWRVWNRRFPWRHSEAFSGAYERASFEEILNEIRSETAL